MPVHGKKKTKMIIKADQNIREERMRPQYHMKAIYLR